MSSRSCPWSVLSVFFLGLIFLGLFPFHIQSALLGGAQVTISMKNVRASVPKMTASPSFANMQTTNDDVSNVFFLFLSCFC